MRQRIPDEGIRRREDDKTTMRPLTNRAIERGGVSYSGSYSVGGAPRYLGGDSLQGPRK